MSPKGIAIRPNRRPWVAISRDSSSAPHAFPAMPNVAETPLHAAPTASDAISVPTVLVPDMETAVAATLTNSAPIARRRTAGAWAAGSGAVVRTVCTTLMVWK